ncbi:MAG: alpha-galactosidase [Oscillospiraceae bacterium]|jgi:alpha-galactosidase|nr:alpha-galactosidase [Oscillospiraceae bacterium]
MIVFDRTCGTFTLHTRSTTYQMKADQYGVLLHTYYGPRVGEGDLSGLIQYADRGFSPNPSEAHPRRDYSLDTLPQEYSTCGVGDYRLSSVQVEQPDGSQALDLRYAGYEIRRGKYALPGLPAFRGEDGETLSISLRDPGSGVEAELLYGVFEDYDLITRAVQIVNRGEEPVKLQRVMSLCLDFLPLDLDLITFNGAHVRERWPDRAPIRPGVQGVGSSRGMSSHQHNPFVMICEHDTGEDHGVCYGAALLYSGDFEAMAERSQFGDIRLVMGLVQLQWTLEPGEVFAAPEAALVCSPSGFGQMSRQLHRAVRERLVRDPCQGGRRPVLINNWEATYFDFNKEKLLDIARAAAPLGIELLVMDDGWFGVRDSDTSGLGDWTVNEKKLPGGLGELVSEVRRLGMRFGLWVEPEMISEDSELYRAHPDWALGVPGRPGSRGRGQLTLDFSRKDVREHVYAALRKVLDSAEVSYLKWDMNRCLTDVWSAALPPRRQGETRHRYVLGVYEMLENLRRDYPHMLVEGCAGGGGRFDLGMLYYTPQIWCSDNTDAIDRLRIQYGTSFCYPACCMGAHVSAVPNEQTGRVTPLETRGVAAMSGAFGYEMDVGKCGEAEKAVIRTQVETFKTHYRLIQEGGYYRLTDPFADPELTAWAHVAPDGREALVSIVTGSGHAAPRFRLLRLKGLDPDAVYRINGGAELCRGSVLMNAGWPVPPLRGDYQSLQLHLEAE